MIVSVLLNQIVEWVIRVESNVMWDENEINNCIPDTLGYDDPHLTARKE